MVTLQLPVPVHAPDQPVNVDPVAADAVSVTDAPLFAVAVQVDPQEIPPPDTVPEPAPDFVTDNE